VLGVVEQPAEADEAPWRCAGFAAYPGVFDGLESWREVMKAVLIAMVTVALAQNPQEPCPVATPVPRANLVVQAVDQTWLPVPGATVRLRGAGKGSVSFKAVTDPKGLVNLPRFGGHLTRGENASRSPHGEASAAEVHVGV
jgi:hypothetical protein